MPIAIECIDCGFTALVKDHLGGKVVECPKCKAGIEVPRPEPESNAPGPSGRGEDSRQAPDR